MHQTGPRFIIADAKPVHQSASLAPVVVLLRNLSSTYVVEERGEKNTLMYRFTNYECFAHAQNNSVRLLTGTCMLSSEQ